MALSSLVVDSVKIGEEAIENLVREFVRYDPAKGKIVFTPSFSKLNAKQKILVYLGAVHGWSYIDGESPNCPTTPSDLEQITGVKGGTLRPCLKDLLGEKLIRKDGNNYVPEPANLVSVHQLVHAS